MAERRHTGMIDRRAFAIGAIAAPWIKCQPLNAQNPAVQHYTIGFAPPIGDPLYAQTQTRVRLSRGDTVALDVQRQFHFEPMGRGYRLTSVLTDIQDSAPPRLSRMVRASVTPLLHIPISFLLDAKGQVQGIEALDESWAKVRDGIASLAVASSDNGHESAIFRQLAALDDNGLRALLSNEVRDLLRFAGRDAVAGTVAADGLIAILEENAGGWEMRGWVHKSSGLSWRVDRQFIGPNPPRQGVIGTNMRLSLAPFAPFRFE